MGERETNSSERAKCESEERGGWQIEELIYSIEFCFHFPNFQEKGEGERERQRKALLTQRLSNTAFSKVPLFFHSE